VLFCGSISDDWTIEVMSLSLKEIKISLMSLIYSKELGIKNNRNNLIYLIS